MGEKVPLRRTWAESGSSHLEPTRLASIQDMDGTGVQRQARAKCRWAFCKLMEGKSDTFRWTSFKALLLEKPSAKQMPPPILFP